MQARQALAAIAGLMLSAGALTAQATGSKPEPQAKPAAKGTMPSASTAPAKGIIAPPTQKPTGTATAKTADSTKHMAKRTHRSKPRPKPKP